MKLIYQISISILKNKPFDILYLQCHINFKNFSNRIFYIPIIDL